MLSLVNALEFNIQNTTYLVAALWSTTVEKNCLLYSRSPCLIVEQRCKMALQRAASILH